MIYAARHYHAVYADIVTQNRLFINVAEASARGDLLVHLQQQTYSTLSWVSMGCG